MISHKALITYCQPKPQNISSLILSKSIYLYHIYLYHICVPARLLYCNHLTDCFAILHGCRGALREALASQGHHLGAQEQHLHEMSAQVQQLTAALMQLTTWRATSPTPLVSGILHICCRELMKWACIQGYISPRTQI